MISRRKAKEWKTLDAWDKNMSIREYINSKIDEIYDGVDRLKDKLKSKDKKIKRIQTNLSYERDWFEELKKQLNAKDEENANLKARIAELEKQQGEYNEI